MKILRQKLPVCLFFSWVTFITSSCESSNKAPHLAASQEAVSNYEIESVMDGFEIIWAFEFLSENEILVNERSGKMWRANLLTKEKKEVQGVPKVHAQTQGGLLDLRLHYNFKSNQIIYFCYSKSNGKEHTTALARARLEKNQLQNLELLFEAQPYFSSSHHFGCRIDFDQQGHLFLSVGDRGNRDRAQDLDTHNGKIIRLLEDGKTPEDNPFVKTKKALPEIWTYGHRNPQGLDYDIKTKQLWVNEHGPRGGDEINLIQKGLNYGWPAITYGKEYVGGSIGEGTKKPGMEQPKHYYVPSIAPSELLIYRGSAFPDWNGHFFSGALALRHINRVELRDKEKPIEERLAKDMGQRIRSIREGPDGMIYFGVDAGEIFRFRPTKKASKN